MVSPHCFSPLALLALLWLFVLHLTGAKPGLTPPPVPAKPKHKRAAAPTAFEGLTHKPHGVVCERAPTPPPLLRCRPIPCRPRTDALARWLRPGLAGRSWAGTRGVG
jgi:hypothetical protein